jgi:hypothetical protein
VKLLLKEINNQKIAKLKSIENQISNVNDALDLIGNADYQGARNIIINEKDLDSNFFDLKTGLAGEILQKYSNYHVRLAIVGDFSKYSSNALKAFILECNRGKHIFFVENEELAIQKLTNN